jgi:hypothetical protein
MFYLLPSITFRSVERFLARERENKLEYVYEFDNLSRQLDLLRGANQKLQHQRRLEDRCGRQRAALAAIGGRRQLVLVAARALQLALSPEMLRSSSSDVDLGARRCPKRRTQRLELHILKCIK